MLNKLQFHNSVEDVLKLAFNFGLDTFFVKVAIKEFDFFNTFDKDGLTFEQLSQKYEIKTRGLNVLLPLFVTLNLLQFKKNKYYLSSLATEYLLASSDKYMGDFVCWGYNYVQYEQLISGIVACLKQDEPLKSTVDFGDWSASLKKEDFVKSFMKVMDQRGLFLASEVAKSINLKNSKKVLDIGGNSGVYSCFLAERFKKIKIDILETPETVAVTKSMLQERGFDQQIEVLGGDMFGFKNQEQYDTYFYSNVLHDWDEKEVSKLIEWSYKQLPEKGKIIIYDGHLEQGHPANKSLLDNNLLLFLYTRGRYYYYDEITSILKKVGFDHIKIKKISLGRSLISADK
jgi:predicted O-methyltransferase YrrM